MAQIPVGVYAISRPNEQLITVLDNELPTMAMALPPTGQPGEQEWVVEEQPNGNVTLRNLRNMGYLGVDDDPQVNLPVLGLGKQWEWALYQSAMPFAFHIVVPGGPIDGTELALDFSLLRIYPPRLALRPLDVNNPWQAWRFQFHE
ncbi:hypothetical protein GFY24_19680 [Nocardia sp. SYP-A9097]|uniref:hypothetical protein n=1 Tax=Nocardia sp. SYP-A9097 TaxID=2663237 RepID=UPI00129A69EB|nr:hypothetical protein [Nocardia sp. SYP-A9097]MRH89637.1 hypothetical protein [Nocardia sp. SYP-A9097]